MELTPQLLETQQFPEKWRGYDQDAVDEFLERVGIGLAELQDRLRTAAARLKEMEGGQPPPPVADPVTTESGTSAVARALVLAQEASDRAVAEATAEAFELREDAKVAADELRRAAAVEADRITADARQAADKLIGDAEAKNAAAASRLADADSHVAAMAADSLAEARIKATTMVEEAEAKAALLTATAQGEADRLTHGATEIAQRHADEVAARRGDDLRELDAKIGERRREAAALQAEINDRQAELRSVVEGLQSLVGRVGLLADPAEPSVQRSQEPPATTPAPTAAPEPVIEPEPIENAVHDAVVIDLTADEARVQHTGSASAASDDGDEDPEESPQSMPKWANLQDVPAEAPRGGLTIVTSGEAEADIAPVAVVELDDLVSTGESDSVPATITVTQSEARMEPNIVEAPVVESSVVRDADAGAIVDDPFLAALRGPDRVEFDDAGEPDADASSFKRRRRRRL